MKRLLKIELSRAFRNPLFLMALLLGCGVSVVHLYIHVLPAVRENLTLWPVYYRKLPPNSVFNTALGFESFSMPYLIFIYIIPILAALPFADSLYTDIKSGYIKNVFIRTQKHNYFIAKYIAVFLTAGTAVVIPLLLSLIVSSAFLPSIIPEPYTNLFPMRPDLFMGHLYFGNPFIYVFLWYIVTFVFSGLLAVFSLALTHFVLNRFLVLLSPFILYISLSMLALQFPLRSFSIMYWILPVRQVNLYSFIPVLAAAVMLWIPALAVYIIKGRRYETY